MLEAIRSTATGLVIKVQLLISWIVERESIRRKKEAGEPPPWTNDPILQTFRFCNVERERDFVSVWIAKNWLSPHAGNPDLFLAAAVARLTNYPPALREIGFPLPWDIAREQYLAAMARRRAHGEICFDAAYRPPVDPHGTPTAQYHAEKVFDRLWAQRVQLRPKPDDTLRTFQKRLQRSLTMSGWGLFITGQIVADLKFFAPLRNAVP
jgi:5-hmdU DNA kinase, helical domain